jgi:hypothetical protein
MREAEFYMGSVEFAISKSLRFYFKSRYLKKDCPPLDSKIYVDLSIN